MKRLTFVLAIFIAMSISCFAQGPTYLRDEDDAVANFDTDIVTETARMQLGEDNTYAVVLNHVTMSDAVNLIVDHTIKAKEPVQYLDVYSITYDLTSKTYHLSDQDEDFFQSTSVADIRKELKRLIKLRLENIR